MAIQSGMNLLGVDFSQANDLRLKAQAQLKNALDPLMVQINENQKKTDNNVLGYVNQLAFKHGIESPEFEQGMQQVLANNPRHNLDMGTIFQKALETDTAGVGLKTAGQDLRKKKGELDDAAILNQIAPLLTKRNLSDDEKQKLHNLYGSLSVTSILNPAMEQAKQNDNYTLQGLNIAAGRYDAGYNAGGVAYDNPLSSANALGTIMGLQSDPQSLIGAGPGGGVAGTSGGTGGLFPLAPTAQTQSSGKAGGASVPTNLLPYINSASKKHGVNASLIAAIAATESSFNPNAVNTESGALGLMQLMPATAKELGVHSPMNVGQNIEGGAKYIGQMLKKYKGNTQLALMAYNWGPGNVDKYLAGKKQPPKETRDYVGKVLGEMNKGVLRPITNTPAGASAPAFAAPKVNSNVIAPSYQKKLSNTDPRIAEVLSEAATNLGIKLGVSEGIRDKATQEKYVSQGKSQTMNSKHLHGGAVDFFIIGKDGKANWNFEAYKPLAAEAKRIAAAKGYQGFTWGGDWKTLKDGVHFEFANSSGGGAGAGGIVRPDTIEGFMNGMSMEDALGMLGPGTPRPEKLEADMSAFNLVMETLGLDKNDPIVQMMHKFKDLGAKRGEEVSKYRQQILDHNQYKSDQVSVANQYLSQFASNKVKVDSAIAKQLQDAQTLQQVQSMTSGGLVGTLGKEVAKEFVDYLKSNKQIGKDDFYMATPAEQLTLLKDFASTQGKYAGMNATAEEQKKLDGVVGFDKLRDLSNKVADSMIASETASNPQDTKKITMAQNKYYFAATAVRNTIAGLKKDKVDSEIKNLDGTINFEGMKNVYTNSINEFNRIMQKEQANKKGFKWMQSTSGFNDKYQLTKEEQAELQKIVARNLKLEAQNYKDKLDSSVNKAVASDIGSSKYESLTRLLQQFDKQI